MPKRRSQIEMTHDEIVDFLHGRHAMAIATIGPDGNIHQAAMWYGFLDDAPAMWTYAKSQKVRNLERDPRISGLVEDGDRYEELRGVELSGKGQIIGDPAVVVAVGTDIYGRYFGPVNEDTMPIVERMAAKRVAVRIEATRTVSWDHRKLGGVY
jgi:PPOX class probable F420-dependent enzyme